MCSGTPRRDNTTFYSGRVLANDRCCSRTSIPHKAKGPSRELRPILAHAALCFVLYVAIAAALDDQMIAFAIMIPVALLTSVVVRRRLCG
jgi:hypothetical protein